jgi:hypothetical protein
MERYQPSEEDGQRSLQEHAEHKALQARAVYGPDIDYDAILAILQDSRFTRYPTRLLFDSEALAEGEFAYAQPVSDNPADGYILHIHPCFEHRTESLPLLIAYHIPAINYGDITTSDESETFGASLFCLSVDDYYQMVCHLADSMPK